MLRKNISLISKIAKAPGSCSGRKPLATAVLILMLLFGILTFVSSISPSLIAGSSSGMVYSQNGVPVIGASVIASGPEGDGFATTDSSGIFRISEGLKTGDYTVSVIALGYLMAEKTEISVAVGEETSNVDFYLQLSGMISGKVSDTDSGAAIANVIVMAITSDQQYGGAGITDLNGNYLIATNLATDIYNVTVFFPEGYVGKTVSGVEVTEGVETTGVDLDLKPSGVISGTVTAVDGTPLVNATVTVSSEDGKYFGFATIEVSGEYRVSSGLGPSTYTVFAIYKMGFTQVSDVAVIAGEETNGVNLVIDVPPPTPTGGISGKVTDSEGNPIEGTMVTALGPTGYGSAITDEDGKYLISEGLDTGTYMVEATAMGFLSRSITDVEVEVGKETKNVNFELERIPPEESGIISGTVLGDENPLVKIEESSITCVLSHQTITVNSNVTISGAINPELSAQVTIQASEDSGDTWTTLTNVTSAIDGKYSHEWTLTEVGSYQVRARVYIANIRGLM